MVFKSIKWRWQLWYGLILVVVLAGFGLTAFQLERGRVLRKVDDELSMRLHLLTGALHPLPPGPRAGPPPPGRLPGPAPSEMDREAPPPPADQFQLPPWAEHFFGTNDGYDYYYLVYARQGMEIARGGDVPKHVTAVKVAEPIDFRTLDGFREIYDRFPRGEFITVGRSLAPETKELRRAALRLTVVGAAILIFGLAGGWWIAGRAIRPLADISATAVRISGEDLSQRISIADTDSELGQLAVVLNATFARLEAAFAQQRQFTADAAHELRTPVSVILTQTQTALQRERGAAEYRETVEACQRAAQRMRRLTESLLELARLEAGQEPLKRLKFNLAQTVWECVELVRPLAAERGIQIHCDLSPVEACGDAERLALVITNLLTNAIQYNRANGEIRAAAKLQGSMILLTVRDTGAGISSEDLPRIFERFYRADPSRSSGQAGLGLAICRAIVEAQGGTIEVSSQPGAGTTFTVVLPV